MDKKEVLQALKAAGEVGVMSDHYLWRIAFELYNKASGLQMHPREMCQKCFNRVLEWLQN